jgi:hypothetical protein
MLRSYGHFLLHAQDIALAFGRKTAAHALLSLFLFWKVGSQPGFGYALPKLPCSAFGDSVIFCNSFFQTPLSNYKIKATSVETLASSFASGASAPYFGC